MKWEKTMMKSIWKKYRMFRANTYQKAQLLEREGVKMGKKCQIFNRCSFGSEPFLIEFGDYVKVTTGCKFITHDGGVEVLRNIDSSLKDIDVFGKIVIGNNVFFGNNVIVLPNVTIGDNVVIGAGAVVTKSFPSNVVIAGVPAKVVSTLDDYKAKVLTKADRTKGMSAKDKKDYLLNKINR